MLVLGERRGRVRLAANGRPDIHRVGHVRCCSPEGLVLRSKLVSGAINLILDHVTISPKDMPTIVYMDALTQVKFDGR